MGDGGRGGGGEGGGALPSRCSDSSAGKIAAAERGREDTLHDDIYPVLAALQPTKAIYTHIDHSLLFY